MPCVGGAFAVTCCAVEMIRALRWVLVGGAVALVFWKPLLGGSTGLVAVMWRIGPTCICKPTSGSSVRIAGSLSIEPLGVSLALAYAWPSSLRVWIFLDRTWARSPLRMFLVFSNGYAWPCKLRAGSSLALVALGEV